MATITRQPRGTQPAGYAATPKQVKQTQAFNKDNRFTQGFRQVIAAQGDTLLKIQLDAPGVMLLGYTIIPVTGSDITDTSVVLTVNSTNLETNSAAQGANPTAVQGMLFKPTPQPLAGNDTITMKFTKNDANTATVNVTIFYVPRT